MGSGGFFCFYGKEGLSRKPQNMIFLYPAVKKGRVSLRRNNGKKKSMVGVAFTPSHRLVGGAADCRVLERRDEPHRPAGEASSSYERPFFHSLDRILRPVPAVFYSCVWNRRPCGGFQPEEYPQGSGARFRQMGRRVPDCQEIPG